MSLNAYSVRCQGTIYALFLVLGFLLMPEVTFATVGKLAPPTAAAEQDALKLVRDVYKDEIAAAKTPTDKVALASKLIQTSMEEKDPAGQFALLSVARDMATESGDIDTAVQAINQMGQSFQIDTPTAKTNAAVATAKNISSAEYRQRFFATTDNLVAEALAADRFDIAKQLGELRLESARTANDPAAIKRYSLRVQQIRETEAAYADYMKFLVVLADKPTDPDANLKAGKYRCYVKGDWKMGLPMLVLGNDVTLKGLAEQEITDPQSAEEQIKLADGWWDIADKEIGAVKKTLQRHSVGWYKRAFPQLTGISKAKAEKRLKELDVAPLGTTGGDTQTDPLGVDADKTAAMISADFPEIVGCRVKQTVSLNLNMTHDKIDTEAVLYEGDLLNIQWSLAPELVKTCKRLAVGVLPSDGNVNDQKAYLWRAKDLTATSRNILYGQTSATSSPNEAKTLKMGRYMLVVLAFDKLAFEQGQKEPIGMGVIPLTVNPPTYTQISIDNLQPDGKIKFCSIQQYKNESGDKMTTWGFINSDFVHLRKMTDSEGRELKFKSTHEGNHYRYLVTFNEPVPFGKMVIMASEGEMTGLVKPMTAGFQDSFQYEMTHFPNAVEITRRIEIYRLPKGAELLKIESKDMLKREVNGQIELAHVEMIPPKGHIMTSFVYKLAKNVINEAR
ncbi:MAG: hypothetical protein WCI73_03495 [Phycisphaerae bacterium]